jgi:hypothetical protein
VRTKRILPITGSRDAEDLAVQALCLRGAYTLYADPETAVNLESVICKAGGTARLAVRPHRGLLPGEGVVAVRRKGA